MEPYLACADITSGVMTAAVSANAWIQVIVPSVVAVTPNAAARSWDLSFVRVFPLCFGGVSCQKSQCCIQPLPLFLQGAVLALKPRAFSCAASVRAAISRRKGSTGGPVISGLLSLGDRHGRSPDGAETGQAARAVVTGKSIAVPATELM